MYKAVSKVSFRPKGEILSVVYLCKSTTKDFSLRSNQRFAKLNDIYSNI